MFTAILSKSSWTPPNVLENGDMESTCCWDGYSEIPSGILPLINERSIEEVHQGNYSRKVRGNHDAYICGIRSDPFFMESDPLIGWTMYDFSYWLYSDDIGSPNWTHSLWNGDGSWNGSGGGGGGPYVPGEWSQWFGFIQNFYEGPLGRIGFTSDTNSDLSTYYIDDVKFWKRVT